MHRFRTFIPMILLLLIASLTACDAIMEPLTSAPEVDTVLIEEGVRVYRANYCGSCHTLEIANTRGNFGPAHDDAAIAAAEHLTLETYNGEADTIEAYLQESIVNPAVFYTPGYETTNHHMPAFTHLPQADIEAMVYMLAHQR